MKKNQDHAKDSGEIAKLDALIDQVHQAAEKFSHYSQAEVDAIFKALAIAADAARIPLAEAAYAETKMGIMEDKIIKNHFAAEFIYHKYHDCKTCGIIEEDQANGIKKVAI